ncbi:FAD-dependent monooxygenase [Paramicrobacterium chengjingii]|uniref:FAD-dependent monooxygenase n=1 Tax=Paramicrobacterium chengjingii TaxID=2769067 RepID=UPI001422D2C9|nr:FAD-dependent monooxygenase [Microbacterium chengjingii]
MTQKSILISGAGIAGATAAFWLSRSGWNVTIVEKAAQIRSSGNPIDVRGQAASIVHQMGLWPEIQRFATGVNSLVIVDAQGRRRATVTTRTTPDPQKEVEVARATLASVLLQAATTDAELIVSDSISGIGQDVGGVDVDFTSGRSRRFDIVLGADGLHSNVRRLVFGPEGSFSRPFGMFVGTMRTTLEGGDASEVMMFNRPNISLSVHAAGGDPLAAFIFRSRDRYDRHDAEARKHLVTSAYSDQGWQTNEAVAEWCASDDVYFDEVTRIAMPSWSRGRIGLLGDAANCISLLGEGSSSAIVAAKTLSDALAAHPNDHAAAFTSYEAVHRQRLRALQRFAGASSHFLVPTSRLGLWLRNSGLALVSGRRR